MLLLTAVAVQSFVVVSTAYHAPGDSGFSGRVFMAITSEFAD